MRKIGPGERTADQVSLGATTTSCTTLFAMMCFSLSAGPAGHAAPERPVVTPDAFGAPFFVTFDHARAARRAAGARRLRFFFSSGMTCRPNISMDDITLSWG